MRAGDRLAHLASVADDVHLAAQLSRPETPVPPPPWSQVSHSQPPRLGVSLESIVAPVAGSGIGETPDFHSSEFATTGLPLEIRGSPDAGRVAAGVDRSRDKEAAMKALVIIDMLDDFVHGALA